MAAPTVQAITDIKSPFAPQVALGFDFAFAASTLTDGDTVQCTGREIILLFNSTGGALTVTVDSQPDEKGRSGNIAAYSVAAGAYSALGVGLTNAQGWKAPAGTIKLTCSAVGLKIAVLRLPAGFP